MLGLEQNYYEEVLYTIQVPIEMLCFSSCREKHCTRTLTNKGPYTFVLLYILITYIAWCYHTCFKEDHYAACKSWKTVIKCWISRYFVQVLPNGSVLRVSLVTSFSCYYLLASTLLSLSLCQDEAYIQYCYKTVCHRPKTFLKLVFKLSLMTMI